MRCDRCKNDFDEFREAHGTMRLDSIAPVTDNGFLREGFIMNLCDPCLMTVKDALDNAQG